MHVPIHMRGTAHTHKRVHRACKVTETIDSSQEEKNRSNAAEHTYSSHEDLKGEEEWGEGQKRINTQQTDVNSV